MIRFPVAQQVDVTAVVVTYGGWDWATRALEALLECTGPVYEVVVIDNASPDGTGERLRAEVAGATVVLNDENIGFGPAANQGAALGTGRYLCFLNPDAIVEPGWLPPLLETLDADPRAAAAVPMLLNMDGTLQEAGSLVGFDGETWAYGHGDDPSDPAYRFRRYVDYGSAACMLVERAAFEVAGGFDPAYQPAYCEDVDLCLALAARGDRTVYEPRSRVRHARAASSDPARAQAMIERNRVRLFEKWQQVLTQRPWLSDIPFYPHRVIAARDAMCLDRVLVVLDRVPPEDDFLRALAQGLPEGRVTLLATEGGDSGPWPDRGVEVALGPRDWRAWLDLRPFHASVVIAPRDGAGPLDEHLAETQPQARWLPLESLPTATADLASALAGEGVLLERAG